MPIPKRYIVTGKSAFFEEGALIELARDDGTDAPWFTLVEGDHTSMGRAHTPPYPCSYHKLEEAPMPTTTTRNPFQIGDRVVPNGYKANGTQHFFGTTDTMLRWRAHDQLLVVTATPEVDRVIVKRPDVGDRGVCYHPSELRMAAPGECPAPKPERPPLSRGCVVRTNRGVAIVTSRSADSDGDWRVIYLSEDRNAGYLGRYTDYTLLGKVMPDGDMRPLPIAEDEWP